MANWRAHSSSTAEPDSSCDRTLPAVDEEPEDDELSAAHTTPVAPLVPVPSEPPVTRTPGKSSNSVSDEPLQTIPRGFQVRRYMGANVSFPKSLPFVSIYNGLIKVHTMLTAQRNPQIKREVACEAVWPGYQWKGKRAKGYDDARNDLGRGDAHLWQRALNTENALWGDYTRCLTSLGRGISKSPRFPWDKDDANSLSSLASIPQAHSEPRSTSIAQVDEPSPPSVDPRASAAPEPEALPSEPVNAESSPSPSTTASPGPAPLPLLGDFAAHTDGRRSGLEAAQLAGLGSPPPSAEVARHQASELLSLQAIVPHDVPLLLQPDVAHSPPHADAIPGSPQVYGLQSTLAIAQSHDLEPLPSESDIPQASDPAVVAQAIGAMLAQDTISSKVQAICSPHAANIQPTGLSPLWSDTRVYPMYNPTPPSYIPESPGSELPSYFGGGWDGETFGLLEHNVVGMDSFSNDFAQSVPDGAVEALFDHDHNVGQSAASDYTGSA
ncbi:hypothetical protein EVJ58_g9068 [Rhodofomes roseus]|nr:hypothetical protein EVJ58_g9068 [Rhodofomes roseus]